jgi:hypothetical protein
MVAAPIPHNNIPQCNQFQARGARRVQQSGVRTVIGLDQRQSIAKRLTAS